VFYDGNHDLEIGPCTLVLSHWYYKSSNIVRDNTKFHSPQHSVGHEVSNR